MIAAVNHAVNIHKVTDDDGLQLESKILLATQVCLTIHCTIYIQIFEGGKFHK